MIIPEQTRRALSEIKRGLELFEHRREDNAIGLHYLHQQYPPLPGEKYVELSGAHKTYVIEDGKGEFAVGFLGKMSKEGADVLAFVYRVPENILSASPPINILSLKELKASLDLKARLDPVPLERESLQAASSGGGIAVMGAPPGLDTLLDSSSFKQEPPQAAPKWKTLILPSVPLRAAAFINQIDERLTAIGYAMADSPTTKFYEISRNRPGENHKELLSYSIRLKKGGYHFVSILEQTNGGVTDYVAVGYKADVDDLRHPEKMATIPKVDSLAVASLAIGFQARETPAATSGDVISVFRDRKKFYTGRQGVAVPREISPRRSEREQKTESALTPEA